MDTHRAVTVDAVAAIKKPKVEVKDEVDTAHDAQLTATLAAQSKELFKYRDQCEKELGKKEMIAILQYNKQDIPEGAYLILDAIADLLTFGALIRCTTCNDGQFVFNKSGYICTGNISEWLKCESIVREPPRRAARVPQHLSKAHPFLAHPFKVQARAMRYVPPTVSSLAVKKEEALTGPKIVRERPPLENMEFAVVGRVSRLRADLKEAIQRLGGKLVTSVHAKLAAVVATEKAVEQMSDKMVEVKTLGIQVLRDTFVEELGKTNVIEFIKTQSICDWGTDVS